MPSLAHLPVSALGTAAVRIEEFVRATNNSLVIQSSHFMNLENKQRNFSGGYNKMQGSLYTSAVMAADKKRDSRLIALYSYVRAERHSPNLEAQQAAQRIYSVLKVHGTASSMANMALGEETLYIRKILTNLASDAYQEDVATMNLAPWIGSLTRAQRDFDTIYACRSDQHASEVDIALATTQRRELEASICGFLKYIDAMAMVGIDPIWHELHSMIEERLTKLARGSRPENRAKIDAKP